MQHHKHIKLKLALLLAAAVGVTAQEASAVVLNYSAGDLILGFRKTGAANDYLVNLGPSSQFTSLGGASFPVNVGNIGVDLSSASLFNSATWANDPTVFWSISSGTGISGANGEPGRTMFATKGESPFGDIESPWNVASATTQSAPETKMRTVGSQMIGQNSTANSDFGFIQSAGALSSYASFQNAAGSFDYFPGGIEGQFGAGPEALDLYRLQPNSNGAPGQYLGRFTISDTGALTFTPVPEPAGLALAGVALAGLFLRRRKASH